jgi:ABC-type transport system involved in multi-copper enzyme maturation permease subunit
MRMVILTIARLTLREAVRRRLVLAVFILTILLAILSGWAFHKLIGLPCGDNGRIHACSVADQKLLAATLLILLGFMFSFVLAVGAAFLGAPALWADMESGILLAMLPRPIRRGDVLLGKWLGLAVLVAGYTAIACGMEMLISSFTLNYVPPHPVIAIAFISAEALVLLSLAIACSTRVSSMASGIVIILLFGVAWMGGMAGEVGAIRHSQTIENVGTVSSLLLPTDGLWRGAIYNLEPVTLVLVQREFSNYAAGNPFFVENAPSGPYLLWAGGWTIAALLIGIWSFSKKEL